MVKEAWLWSDGNYATQDELDRMVAGRDPYAVAELAARHGLPYEYINSVPDRTFMTSEHAQAYDKFLKDVNQLAWIGKDADTLDVTGWDDLASKHGKTNLKLLHGDDGRILPLNQQYAAIKLQQAILDGRLNYDKQRLQQDQAFNRSLGGTQDTGTVSRSADLSNFVDVYTREARDEAAAAGVKPAALDDFVAKRVAEKRQADRAEMSRLSAIAGTMRKANPDMAAGVDTALHQGGDGGNILQHMAVGAQGVQNGKISSTLVGRASDLLGVTPESGIVKQVLAGIPSMGAQVADSVFNTTPMVRNVNRAITGDATTSNAFTKQLNVAQSGNTGDIYNASGLRAAVDVGNAALMASAMGGLANGAARFTISKALPSSTSIFTRHPIAAPAVLGLGIGGSTYAEDRENPGTERGVKGYAKSVADSLSGTAKRIQEGKPATATDMLTMHNLGQLQLADEAAGAQPEQPAKPSNEPKAKAPAKNSGGSEWYKNPWVWAAGGTALLGGGLLLNSWMDKRRRRAEKVKAKPAPQQSKAVAPKVMPRQQMLPYDYRQEQPIDLGYAVGDDPFDMYTGDYYY